jgi:uncharacterized protein HemY
MAGVAVIVIVVLTLVIFFVVGFAVGVRIVGIVGRWWAGRRGRGADADRKSGRRKLAGGRRP